MMMTLLYIYSIPDPTHLHSALPSPKKTAAKSKAKQVNVGPTALFVRPRRVAAILVPSGLGVQDWSSFGQCLCIDWFPGNQHTRIAAGYHSGKYPSLCVLALCCRLTIPLVVLSQAVFTIIIMLAHCKCLFSLSLSLSLPSLHPLPPPLPPQDVSVCGTLAPPC